MDIGLCCGTLVDTGLVDLIEIAGRHGFPTITVRPLSFIEALEQGETESSLRRRLANAGVRVTMVDALTKGLPGVAGPESLDPALRAILPRDAIDPPDEETCLRSAEALGARFVNVAHFRGRPVPLEEMADAIGHVCRRAAARGLSVALEFIPGTGLPDLSHARQVIERCGEPNCRITVDFWHLDRSGGTLEDLRQLPAGMIAGLQLCDRVPPPPGTPYIPMSGRDLPGEGQLPLHDLVRAALENTPGISAEVEVLKEEFRHLPADAVAARIAAAVKTWRAAYASTIPSAR